jgi:hypothetical protein
MPHEGDPAQQPAAQQNLPAETRQQLNQVVADLRRKIVDEADRLATDRDQRTGGTEGGALITPADIHLAAHFLYLAGLPEPARLSVQQRIYQGVSYLAAIIAGYFLSNIDKAWGSITFVIVASAGMATFLLGGQERRRSRQ